MRTYTSEQIRSFAFLSIPFAVLLVATACSGNSTKSPAAPSSDTPGAAIAGIVTAGTGSSGSPAAVADVSASPAAATAGAPMSGVTVQVIGTSLSAVASESGEFLIDGVPAGKVRLQFRKDAVNATTDLGDVKSGQLVQIQVQLSGSAAVVVSDTRSAKVTLCHAEGNGTYHSISVSEDAEASHRAHGDGKVGDPVPGRPNMVFDENCRPAGPAVDIEKLTNGQDADTPPGPSIKVGDAVNWEYRVKNTGTVNLTGVGVVDDKGVSVNCSGQTTLAAAATMTCTGSGVAVLGQYRNVGTVTASWSTSTGSGTVTDSDASHYLGVAPDEEEGQKVTLCHKTGAGFYNKIEVSVSAEPAHRAHGDGKIGEAVPGSPGKVFSASCSVQ